MGKRGKQRGNWVGRRQLWEGSLVPGSLRDGETDGAGRGNGTNKAAAVPSTPGGARARPRLPGVVARASRRVRRGGDKHPHKRGTQPDTHWVRVVLYPMPGRVAVRPELPAGGPGKKNPSHCLEVRGQRE